jgi:hypothetical protein
MLVRVKRFFISSVFGNVDEGRILDVDDRKAKQLIDAGLAAPHIKQPVAQAPASSFQQPVGVATPGPLSQADQASQNTTASSSDSGAKRVIYRKPKRKSLS